MSTNSTKKNHKNKVTVVREITPRSVRPPTYDPNFRVTRKFRYTVGSAQVTMQPVSWATLIESFGAMCTATNSTAVPTFGWIKLKSIEMWGLAPNGSSGPSRTEIALVWGYQASTMNAPEFSTNKEANDTSTSITYVPHFYVRPPKGSAAAMWQPRCDTSGTRRTGSSNIAFSVQANVGTIIDVVAELVMYDAGPQQAITNFTIAVGTAGAWAYAGLDGVSLTMPPVGVGYFA